MKVIKYKLGMNPHSRNGFKKGHRRNVTHSMTHTRFYKAWQNAKTRVLNKNTPYYKYYGGRGIKLEWKLFNDFYNDMFSLYLEHSKQFGKNNATLDRIDNNGHYNKENCRWATMKEQSVNRRSCVFLTFKGQTLTMKEWATRLGFKEGMIVKRKKLGWSTNDMLTILPKQRCGNQFGSHKIKS